MNPKTTEGKGITFMMCPVCEVCCNGEKVYKKHLLKAHSLIYKGTMNQKSLDKKKTTLPNPNQNYKLKKIC